jgi:hypothetical protein
MRLSALLLCTLVLRCSVAVVSGALPSSVAWWQTARDLPDRLKQHSDLTPVAGAPPRGVVVVSVPSNAPLQPIYGFGGAFTQASAFVFKQLDAGMQHKVLDMYFGESGIGYSMGRIPIHSCDFSPKVYTFDDMANDDNMTYFDKTLRDDVDLLALIRAAMATPKSSIAAGVGKLFASPWSPPYWMKTNNNMLNGGSLRSDRADAWANYISTWVSAYNTALQTNLYDNGRQFSSHRVCVMCGQDKCLRVCVDVFARGVIRPPCHFPGLAFAGGVLRCKTSPRPHNRGSRACTPPRASATLSINISAHDCAKITPGYKLWGTTTTRTI